jgi:hypothetical protein
MHGAPTSHLLALLLADVGAGTRLERGTGDPLKAKSAEIFYRVWQGVEANPTYKSRKVKWKRPLG